MASEAIAATPAIKVAAICGSLRKGSFNRGLIRSGTDLILAFRLSAKDFKFKSI